MKIRKLFKGLTLQISKDFIPNLILAFGAVFVWRGVWGLMDTYFFPNHADISFSVSVLIGILLIYLPDHSFSQLGGLQTKEPKKKKHSS